jgi:hypothetical protein
VICEFPARPKVNETTVAGLDGMTPALAIRLRSGASFLEKLR